MLKNRPVVIFCLTFVGGIAAGLFLRLGAALVLLALIYLAALLIECRKKLSVAVFVAIAIFAFGIACSVFNLSCTRGATAIPSKAYTVEAYVKDIKATANGYNIKLEGVSGKFDGYGFQLYLDSTSFETGYKVHFNCKLTNSSNYSKANGVDFTVSDFEMLSYGEEAEGIVPLLLRLRERIGDFISNAVGDEDASGFYTALFTGDASGLSHDKNSLFARSGISHILVVSGQHFSLLIINLYTLLMLTVRRKKLCSVISIVACVAFALFTGASPSVLRAAFMCGIYFVFNMSMTESDPFITLTLSLTVILLISPCALLSPSLQLSFLSTFGLVLSSQYINRKTNQLTRKGKAFMFFITPLLLSFVCTLFCMPVFLTVFDGISAFAPLTNMLINAFVTPMFVVGIPFSAFAGAFTMPFFSEVLCEGVNIIIATSEYVASFDNAYISVSVPYIKWAILPSLSAILICPFVKMKKRIAILSVSVIGMVIILFGAAHSYKRSLSDDALLLLRDDASSSYAFIADGEEAILLDVCGTASPKTDIFGCGFTYVDKYVILDCTDESFYRLQRTAEYVTVREICLPKLAAFDMHSKYYDIILYCEKEDIKINEYSNGEKLEFNSCSLITADYPQAQFFILEAAKANETVNIYGVDIDIAYDYTKSAKTAILPSYYFPKYPEIELLQENCNTIYIYTENDITDYDALFPESDYLLYQSKLMLRFGEDGTLEVKGQ